MYKGITSDFHLERSYNKTKYESGIYVFVINGGIFWHFPWKLLPTSVAYGFTVLDTFSNYKDKNIHAFAAYPPVR